MDWITANWDLEANAGMAGEHSTDGLYYYYMTMARALAVAEIDELELPGGEKVDWSDELSKRLTSAQKDDGSWLNDNSRWMETEPLIVTAYSLLALADCAL